MNAFKGRHFTGIIILWAVRWYCKYGISYRELQEMLAERGVNVDHSTIYRWVQRYAPEIEKRLRWYWCNPTDLQNWYLDETYVKVNGKWVYLYRAVDNRGHTIDFYLSLRRNTKAAYRFLRTIFNRVKKWQIPGIINTDKAAPYAHALNLLKQELLKWAKKQEIKIRLFIALHTYGRQLNQYPHIHLSVTRGRLCRKHGIWRPVFFKKKLLSGTGTGLSPPY